MNPVVMPKMGITMESAKIVAWNKEVGEEIKEGEELFVIETEKSEIAVESAYTGVLKEIVVSEGEEAPVDAVLAYIE